VPFHPDDIVVHDAVVPLLVNTWPFVPGKPATCKLPCKFVTCPERPMVIPVDDVFPMTIVPELSINEQFLIVDTFITPLKFVVVVVVPILIVFDTVELVLIFNVPALVDRQNINTSCVVILLNKLEVVPPLCVI